MGYSRHGLLPAWVAPGMGDSKPFHQGKSHLLSGMPHICPARHFVALLVLG
ncbi:hypothetical protein GCD22_01452 [Acidithiobacillus thiooxidans ATCC 19377]|uniref:Uncharacterized protein n=1 Tax=Acidithiobacillus thiooxidans ATCC 19377 TaxID=637390 RepID=A0A5P9XRN9_ACITH|nr:hypothetical protein GCD22_01452 [Acidithiobacillus thiooxidans ATCC 19377]